MIEISESDQDDVLGPFVWLILGVVIAEGDNGRRFLKKGFVAARSFRIHQDIGEREGQRTEEQCQRGEEREDALHEEPNIPGEVRKRARHPEPPTRHRLPPSHFVSWNGASVMFLRRPPTPPGCYLAPLLR